MANTTSYDDLDTGTRAELRFWRPELDRRRALIDLDIRAKIFEVIRRNGPWPLFFWGRPGRGKTCAALAMLDYWQAERSRGWYAETLELTDRLTRAKCGRLTWPGGAPMSAEALWKNWGQWPLTVLDEMGTRLKISDTAYETVKEAIDTRHGKPAVFISNLRLGALGHVYDGRIVSRLAEGTAIEFGGPDRRIRGVT